MCACVWLRGGVCIGICTSFSSVNPFVCCGYVCVCVCVSANTSLIQVWVCCVFPEGRLSRSDQRERWRLTDQTREAPQKDRRDSSLLAQVPIIWHINTHNQWSGECTRGQFERSGGILKKSVRPKLTLSLHSRSRTLSHSIHYLRYVYYKTSNSFIPTPTSVLSQRDALHWYGSPVKWV